MALGISRHSVSRIEGESILRSWGQRTNSLSTVVEPVKSCCVYSSVNFALPRLTVNPIPIRRFQSYCHIDNRTKKYSYFSIRVRHPLNDDCDIYWLVMNGAAFSDIGNLLEEDSSSSFTSASDQPEDNSATTSHYRCQDCDSVLFLSRQEFETHLRTHLKEAIIPIQRLTRSYVLQIKANKPRTNSQHQNRQVARKRTSSYIVPKSKPLKITLKRSQSNDASSSSSFKVVKPKILTGPGETFVLNGDISEVIKAEDTSSEGTKAERVEGSSEKQVEGGEVAETSKRKTPDNIATAGTDKLKSKTNKEESDTTNTGSDSSSECSETTEENNADLASLVSEDNKLDIQEELNLDDPVTSDLNTSEDQAATDFLDSNTSSTPSANMVEVNGSTLTDAPSPTYPSTSPDVPPAPASSESQVGMNGDDSLSQPAPPDIEQSGCEDQSDMDDAQHSFAWNSVGTTNAENIQNESTSNNALEDRDPLLLPDQGSVPSQMADEDSGMGLDLNTDTGSLDGGDSLLGSFLCEQAPDKAPVPVTNVGNIEGLGLGSEYMEIERLGEGLSYCDVCGESASDQQGLEDHRIQAGHYKCNEAECGMVLPTGNELLAHQQTLHSTQPYGQTSILNQQAPVQQLVQQVQRLPVPQMPVQQQQPPPQQQQQQMVQQLQPQMHAMMPQQPSQFQGAVHRPPPPLYRGNAPASMAPPTMQQHPPPQYTGQQRMMYSQSYSQQGQNYQQAGQIQARPFSNMIQQLNQPRGQMSHRMPGSVRAVQPGAQQGGVKRVVPQGPRAGSPSNKQRRLDVLIPDRHDDADCHVIAMQKRTNSGPVIGNVQGASGHSGSPNRPDSMIHLTDSITLSVRQPQGGQTVNIPVNGAKKSDAKAVANILATRGITVTPAGGGAVKPSQNQQVSPQRHVVNRNQQPAAPAPVPTLNLNAAISIIPTASGRQQPSRQQSSGGNFSVPQGRSPTRVSQQPVERPPRPPTVDLTQDTPPSNSLQNMRNRGRGRPIGVPGRYTCQLCDKVFSTQDGLNQHMNIHRSPNKLPFRCSLCSAQYPTQQGLLQHRQAYHKETLPQPGSELVIPIIDIKQAGTVNSLMNLGIYNYIPLSQLPGTAAGQYGIPIANLDGTRGPIMGSTNVFNLGPIKQIPM